MTAVFKSLFWRILGDFEEAGDDFGPRPAEGAATTRLRPRALAL